MDTEAHVVRVLIQSNTEVPGGEFDLLLSLMSSIVICCLLALELLVLAETLISSEGTNPRPTLEGLTTYPYCLNFF